MPASGELNITLPVLDIGEVEVMLIGDTSLICNAWSKKARDQMLNKQMKKAATGRAAKNPEEDFQASLYRIGDGTYGFPVIGFKAAAVTACTSIGSITKVMARQSFHVKGDAETDYTGNTPRSNDLVRIQGSEPVMREDMVRVGMGTADIRYRGEFFPWFVVLKVRFNKNVLSPEQILNLLNTAGFGVGVGEWRAERDGQNGLFHCADAAEMRHWYDFEMKRIKAVGLKQAA